LAIPWRVAMPSLCCGEIVQTDKTDSGEPDNLAQKIFRAARVQSGRSIQPPASASTIRPTKNVTAASIEIKSAKPIKDDVAFQTSAAK
jgi:hypothetical protein